LSSCRIGSGFRDSCFNDGCVRESGRVAATPIRAVSQWGADAFIISCFLHDAAREEADLETLTENA